ncbi:hypothetical protein AV530_003365 [Patagioenas fasciata monilis]|uniref:Integrin alpha-2 domain-containing protein n=1 Tax=Patagioenas fasciata monilis TaxID=372326 RepID=A0A1V4K3V0_PATFA|nr:hypothetical protein AV530_003365 [Patagioenas fasciata monilis]
MQAFLQAATRCWVRGEAKPDLRERFGRTGAEEVRDVRYQGVCCSIPAGRDTVTVTAELSLTNVHQFLKSRTVLLVPGKITFNRELYLALTEENHRAEITLVFLQDEVFNLWPVIIGSCAGGLILLAFLTVLLWKCGFFKRNFKAMMEQENLPEN